jgi:hypothetical protein
LPEFPSAGQHCPSRIANVRLEYRGVIFLEGAMFLCQPLLEVLAGRGIEDIDAFLKVPSWNDLPCPFSIPSMEKATALLVDRHTASAAEMIVAFARENSLATIVGEKTA